MIEREGGESREKDRLTYGLNTRACTMTKERKNKNTYLRGIVDFSGQFHPGCCPLAARVRCRYGAGVAVLHFQVLFLLAVDGRSPVCVDGLGGEETTMG